MPNCLNCGAKLGGTYCTDCGQASSTDRLRIKEILDDAISNMLNLDSKVPRTIVGLTRNPGQLVSEYVAGRRTVYVSPLRYCLVTVALMVLVYVAFDIDLVRVTATSTSVDPEEQLRIEELRLQIVRILNSRLNLVIFLALPFLGLLMKALFRRSGRNYAECVVFILFTMGHVFLLSVPLAVMYWWSAVAGNGIRLVLQISFLVWAAVGFFGESVWRTTLKSVTATIAYALLVSIVALGLAWESLSTLLSEAIPV